MGREEERQVGGVRGRVLVVIDMFVSVAIVVGVQLWLVGRVCRGVFAFIIYHMYRTLAPPFSSMYWFILQQRYACWSPIWNEPRTGSGIPKLEF